MPAQYEKLGVSFRYPENWTLDERDAVEGDNSVTVNSPGGGFWTVVVHPPLTKPSALAETAMKAMKQEYRDLDAERVRETVAGRPLIGYDLNFYCLDLTNTALIRAAATEDATYLIFCQADDREFETVESVFRAMTASLLEEA